MFASFVIPVFIDKFVDRRTKEKKNEIQCSKIQNIMSG